ncbi:MAG: RNA 3'-terminal phosphate cyclase [Planctomycetes bacterium]|nr:RNA 3'-terminal phosphate cyclase [Planctomycetota bacterium]
MIVIDGRMGEGGGQILRTALSCSVLTGSPINIGNIRANRKNPGLAAQHLTAVKAAARICDAGVTGDTLRSREIEFYPGKVTGTSFKCDVGTAGSLMLVFQTVLYPLLFGKARTSLKLQGGTHVEWSPSFHYICETYLPALRTMGIHAGLELERPGFYPKGGGKIRGLISSIDPEVNINPLQFQERGELKHIKLMTYTADLPEHVPAREIAEFRKIIGYLPMKPEIIKLKGTADNPGNMLLLVLQYEDGMAGFQSIAKLGKRAETLAREVVRDYRAFADSEASVDGHLADQLILPCILAEGESSYTTPKVSMHLSTNAEVAKMFFPKVEINIEGEQESFGKITINSPGYKNLL